MQMAAGCARIKGCDRMRVNDPNILREYRITRWLLDTEIHFTSFWTRDSTRV